MAEEKPTKGFSLTGFFWSLSRRQAAKQLPFLRGSLSVFFRQNNLLQ